MPRFSFLVAVSLLLIAILPVNAENIPGLPEQVNDGKPVEITVFGLPPATDAFDISAKANVAVADAFMKRYPNVRLRPFSFLRVPGAGTAMLQDTNTLMSMAAGIAPDVLQVNFRQSDSFIRQGFLLPLDSYIDQLSREPGGKAELARLIPTRELWQVVKRGGPDGKVHTWMMPTALFAITMNYRKDVLRTAGLDPNHPPETWDEFYRMCVQVSDPRPGKGTYGTMLPNSWYMTWILWSAGSEILKQRADNPDDWYAAYDDDASVVANQFAWKLLNGPWVICPTCETHYAIEPKTIKATCPKGHTFTVRELTAKKMLFRGVCPPKSLDAWGTGKQAFSTNYMLDTQLAGPTVDPALIGIAQVPRGPTGISSAELNSCMLAINGTMKDRTRIEAAWAYIRFRTSEVAKGIQTRVYVEGGFAKYLNPAYLRQFGYTEYLREVPPGWEKTYQAALKSGHPEPYGKNAQQIYAEMDKSLDQVAMLPDAESAKIKAILAQNVARTNERLIGIIPPDVQKLRSRVAFILVALSIILFTLLIRYTLTAYGHALETPSQRTQAARRRIIVAWLVMLPALITVALFQYYPLGRGSLIAFQNYQLFAGIHWNGLTNFGSVLFAPEFWQALSHSLVFALISLSCGFFAPVILALLLHEIPRGSLVLRIIYFLPSVSSGIVILLLWTQLYDSSPYGILNQVLTALHLPAQTFLQDPNLVMLWVVVPAVWAGMGPGSIIYLAALRQIPEDYYEAADIDGAGFFAKFRMITLPYLKPLLIINFVGATVGAFKSFEPILIMTGGGPADATRVVGLEIWQQGFMYLRYGYATAMGWMLASLLIGFTIFQLRYLSKVQFQLVKSE